MRFFAIVIFLAFWSVKADAHVFDKNFKLSSVSSVEVRLFDGATGACWTNLKEVREYAEEKLRMKGVNVVPRDSSVIADYNKSYALKIHVEAGRYFTDGTGNCIGFLSLSLFKLCIKSENIPCLFQNECANNSNLLFAS